VLTHEKGTIRSSAKFDLESDSPIIKYFQGPHLDNSHNSNGFHLGNRKDHMESEDTEKEANL